MSFMTVKAEFDAKESSLLDQDHLQQWWHFDLQIFHLFYFIA